VIVVRDTTDRDGGTLAVSAEMWRRLVAGIRHNEVIPG